MDKNMSNAEIIKIIGEVVDASPSKASPELLATIIANLVITYQYEGQWPSLMMLITTILADAMKENLVDETRREVLGEVTGALEEITGATADADKWLAKIMEKKND